MTRFTDDLLKIAFRKHVQAELGVEVLDTEAERRIDVAYESDCSVEEAVAMVRVLRKGRAA